jgi:Tol biopolymer transport system component
MREGMRRRAGLVSASLLSVTALIGVINIGANARTVPRQGAAVNGRIVFQAGVGSKAAQLFTILPDGSDMNQVTHIHTGNPRKDPGAENPVWSPDGSTILFDSLSHGTPPGTKVNLFTIAPDGSDLAGVPLTVGEFNGDPAYSPDGQQISFDQDVGASQPTVHGIFIANADGSDAHRLTTGLKTEVAYDTESQWSPDGQTIAFTRIKNNKKGAIYTIAVDGTGLTRLTNWKLDAASPDWSPNGRRIAFNSYYDSPHGNVAQVMTMRPDGSHQKAITKDHFGKEGQIYCFRPSWSPDGTRIVFVRFKVKGDKGVDALYTMDPDGDDLERVTTAKHVFPLHPDWGTAR